MAFTATPPRCETCGRWHIPNDPPDCAHEPECGFMTDETLDCICGEIRACEARVRADERDKAAGRVRVEALREARAVVAALVTQSSMSLGHRGSWGDGQRDALAAVDRLIDAAGGA